MILIIGALFGLISVAFGAYAEHGLRGSIDESQLRSLMTALRYNQIHAIIICAIGLSLLGKGTIAESRSLKWSGILFIVGTALFSFSIYSAVSFSIPVLLFLAPMGGMTLMVAWLLLIASGVLVKLKS